MVKPPAQTGFPKEVLGRGSSSGAGSAIWAASLLLPQSQEADGGGGVAGEHSFLPFLMPLTSLSSLVIARIYEYTGWPPKAFLRLIYFMETPY